MVAAPSAGSSAAPAAAAQSIAATAPNAAAAFRVADILSSFVCLAEIALRPGPHRGPRTSDSRIKKGPRHGRQSFLRRAGIRSSRGDARRIPRRPLRYTPGQHVRRRRKMKKVVWGVLGTARIGLQRVLPGMRKSPLIELRAIASRSADAARKAAHDLGIPKAYGSYEALLADPEIEAIYNPLPNHLHVPLTLEAARAGKHVLCEKPIALNAAEAERLRAAAGKALIMEAFMVRFHPQWLRARELVREGAIGALRAVQMFFSYHNTDPDNIRNRPDIGGGALYDIGCYPITAGRFFFEAETRRGIALVDRDPAFRTDRLTSALVDFGGGRHLDFTVSTQCAPYQRIQLCGSKGRIEIHVPVNPAQGAKTRLFV